MFVCLQISILALHSACNLSPCDQIPFLCVCVSVYVRERIKITLKIKNRKLKTTPSLEIQEAS